MCDKCERVFSENEEGWQSATLNTVEYNDDGQQITVPIRQDLCNTCAVPTPRRQKKSDSLDARIAALESSNAKLDRLTEAIKDVPTGATPDA